MIFSLDCCRPGQFYIAKYYLLDQSSALYAEFLKNESQRKKVNRFRRLIFVVSDNTLHITNITTLIVALNFGLRSAQ